MSRFQGQNVLITGGTNGIGLAAAERISREGGRVLVTGENTDRLAAAEKAGFVALRNDASSEGAVAELVDKVKSEFGQLHAAFLNAGSGRFEPLSDITAREFDAQFHLNVRGPLLQTKALAPLLQDGGAVVINTSVVNTIGMAGSSIYAATKAAARSLVRVLARELSGRQIRVNAVSPGPISTNFFPRQGMSQADVEALAASLLPMVPLGRLGRPEEAAAVATFLLSHDASFVTGAEYVVDGGLSQL